MRRITPILLLTLLAGPAASPARAGDGKLAGEPLTRDEHRRLLQHLDQTRTLFLRAVEGLSEAQWRFKPAADRWSIAECAEHLAAAEKRIRGTVVEMLSQPASAEKAAAAAGKVERVIELMADRGRKFQAPEPVIPTGRWESMADTVKAFRAERSETLELAEEGENLRSYTAEHPGFGELTAYGWLFFLSSHTARHTEQIEEVKATEGYPES